MRNRQIALADGLRDDTAIALSLRAKGNALYVMGQNKAATEAHARAFGIFEELGNESEMARTLNATIQPLALLGDYAGAHAAGDKAAALFERLGDHRSGDCRRARENSMEPWRLF